MRQAVILAGGKGTRLAERLGGRPKPLVDVNGVPLLERQLDLIERSGFDDVVILVNHAADQIRAFCDGRPSRLRVTLVDDGEPRGTAGATLAALDELRDRFLVCYGDTLFDVDLERFWSTHVAGASDATLFLHPNDHPHDSDLVELDEAGLVRAFHSYPHETGAFLPNLVNAALYVVEKAAILPWRHAAAPLDFAHDLFPAMVESGCRLRGYVSFEYIKDIGTPKRLDKAVGHLRSGVVERARLGVGQRAVFLDRDGTINQPRGHIASPADLELIGDVATAIRSLNEAEYRVVLVTNQPVIARGEATVDDVRAIHAKLETLLGQGGAFLDLIQVCPHHPDSGFHGEVSSLKINCACRKPEIGLITQARDALNIDLARSWFIGDTTSDMLAARRAGLRALLVRTGDGGRDGRHEVLPDLVFDDAAEAACFIADGYPKLRSRLEPVARTIAPGHLVLVDGEPQAGRAALAKTLGWMLEESGITVSYLQHGAPPPSADSARAGGLTREGNQVLIVDGDVASGLSLEADRPVHRIRIEAYATLRHERPWRDASTTIDRSQPDPVETLRASRTSGDQFAAPTDLQLIKARP